jgi:hypothetical protein
MTGKNNPKKPRLDPRLAERLARKKTQLDRYRPLPPDTVKRLNDDLRIFLTYHSNAIEGNTLSLRETQMVIDYGMTMRGHSLRDWRIRYIQGLDTANTGNYRPLANLIGQAVEAGLDLYLEACTAPPNNEYQLLSTLAQPTGYSVDYLGWLVRQGRIAAVKRRGRWYSTLEEVNRYKTGVETRIASRRQSEPGTNKEM